MDEQKIARQHDERIIREGNTIFSEADLRELINTMYSGYQYTNTQAKKLNGLIDYLALEDNRYVNPEMAVQSERLFNYLVVLRDFLEKNFSQGCQAEDGETIFYFKMEKTSAENEGFLMELQMLAMDVEGAYKKYNAAAALLLQP